MSGEDMVGPCILCKLSCSESFNDVDREARTVWLMKLAKARND